MNNLNLNTMGEQNNFPKISPRSSSFKNFSSVNRARAFDSGDKNNKSEELLNLGSKVENNKMGTGKPQHINRLRIGLLG